MKNLILIAAAAALCAPMAVAQDASTTTTTTTTAKPRYTINQRKQNQQQRIGEGVENGSLTAGEAAKIEHKEAKLNAEEKAMKSDGTLSAQERAKLQHQQNNLSQQIYNQKHDAQVQNTNPKSEVGQRDRAQQQRIGQGIENGSLTPREAGRLEGQEARLNREQHNMRAANGGTLAPAEKA
jgi:Ni,Fe-hydrogenase I large subunit